MPKLTSAWKTVLTPTRRSPLHILPVERETAFSLMSRMASYGGTTASDFGGDIGITFKKILDGVPQAVKQLAAIANTDPDLLLSWTPSLTVKARRTIRNEQFPSKTVLTSVVRGCPLCLQDDAKDTELPPERVMAIRGDWLVPHVSTCIRHEHALVPLWRETKYNDRYDIVPQFAKIAPRILAGEFSGNYKEPTDFDEWLERRLIIGKGQSWLDQYQLNAASSFCRLVGTALMRRSAEIPRPFVVSGEQWPFYQMGFEVVQQGEDAIYDAFGELNRLAEPKQGPKAVFPLLYDRLSHDYRDDPDYKPFRNILASHLLRTWPLGPGDDLLGEPVIERRLHSVTTAAKETGIDTRRLRKMLESVGLIDETFSDSWAVFDAKEAQPLIDSMVSFVTARDFAEGINLSRSQFDLLVEDEILKPTLTDAGTKFVWDPRDGRAFIDKLLLGAQLIPSSLYGWEPIAKAAQRLKIRPAEIIKAIWDGRIRRVGKNVHFDDYRSIHVQHDEVIMAFGDTEPVEMSIEVFSKSVGLANPVYLNRLIRNGHMTATKIRNPKTRALQRYITNKDAAAFHGKFMTLRTLAKSQGTSWQKITAALRANNVSQFSPDGKDYGNLYLKADVEIALK